MAWHNRLKKAVDNATISQAEIARVLDVTPQTIHNWTKGKNSPSVADFLRLCELLEVAPGPIVDESIPEPGENLIAETLKEQIDKLGESEALRRILLAPGNFDPPGDFVVIRSRDETHLEKSPQPIRDNKGSKRPGRPTLPGPDSPPSSSSPEEVELQKLPSGRLNKPGSTGKKGR